MQINNSSTSSLLASQQVNKAQQTDKQTLIINQREQTRTKEQDSQQSKDQVAKKSTSYDIDQHALSRVELYSQERSDESKSAKSSSVNGNYDQPSQQNQFAVNSYRSVEAIPQRESIKQTFGVDLFA